MEIGIDFFVGVILGGAVGLFAGLLVAVVFSWRYIERHRATWEDRGLAAMKDYLLHTLAGLKGFQRWVEYILPPGYGGLNEMMEKELEKEREKAKVAARGGGK